MVTTIQISGEVHELLTILRRTLQAGSYNEVIYKLIQKTAAKKSSLYGFLGKKNMKHILKGLRDEEDRI